MSYTGEVLVLRQALSLSQEDNARLKARNAVSGISRDLQQADSPHTVDVCVVQELQSRVLTTNEPQTPVEAKGSSLDLQVETNRSSTCCIA